MVLTAAQAKIQKTATSPVPSALDIQVAEAIYELEFNVADLKADLRPLQICSAKEIEVRDGFKAIVIFYPFPMMKLFRKVQTR